MSKQTEQLNSYTDAQVVINEYKTGYVIPDDQKVVRYLNTYLLIYFFKSFAF